MGGGALLGTCSSAKPRAQAAGPDFKAMRGGSHLGTWWASSDSDPEIRQHLTGWLQCWQRTERQLQGTGHPPRVSLEPTVEPQ